MGELEWYIVGSFVSKEMAEHPKNTIFNRWQFSIHDVLGMPLAFRSMKSIENPKYLI